MDRDLTRRSSRLVVLVGCLLAAAVTVSIYGQQPRSRGVPTPAVADAAVDSEVTAAAVRLLSAVTDLDPHHPIPDPAAVVAFATPALAAQLSRVRFAGTGQWLTVTDTAETVTDGSAVVHVTGLITVTGVGGMRETAAVAWVCRLVDTPRLGWRVAALW